MDFNPFCRGVLKVGQEIEIRPGLVSKDSEGLIFLHCYYFSKDLAEV